MARLVKQLLTTPKMSLKLRHGQNFMYQLHSRNDQNEEKSAGNVPFTKKLLAIHLKTQCKCMVSEETQISY